MRSTCIVTKLCGCFGMSFAALRMVPRHRLSVQFSMLNEHIYHRSSSTQKTFQVDLKVMNSP